MTGPRDAGDRLEELLSRREPEPEPETLPNDPHGDEGQGPETTQPGAEPEPETGDPLPDAPLFALMRTVEAEIGVDRVDRVWIFPPRQFDAGETAVVVVAAFPDLDQDRRRVYAAHYAATTQGAGTRLALQEFGTAPTERVGRVVEEVVERIKDEPATPPQTVRIEGDDHRWSELLHSLAERHLEEATNHPRFRRPGGPRRP